VNDLVVRCALGVLALLVGAYLAFGVRNVHLTDQADAVLAQARTGPPVTETQLAAALRDYDKARTLSPDPTPLIHSGELQLAAGHKEGANKAIIRAIHDEPDNIEAWFTAYIAAAGNPVARRLTQSKLVALNPWFLYVLTGRDPR
jgi:hypothetical protein